MVACRRILYRVSCECILLLQRTQPHTQHEGTSFMFNVFNCLLWLRLVFSLAHFAYSRTERNRIDYSRVSYLCLRHRRYRRSSTTNNECVPNRKHDLFIRAELPTNPTNTPDSMFTIFGMESIPNIAIVPAILCCAHTVCCPICRPRCGALLVANTEKHAKIDSVFVPTYVCKCDSCACSFHSSRYTIRNSYSRWFTECEYLFNFCCCCLHSVWFRNSFSPFKANTVSIPTSILSLTKRCD